MVLIDYKSNKPIYEQIIEQIKYNRIKGFLQAGDAIPSVRRLAMDISVTPSTVAKAYQELERQGVIETIRGKGTFIAPNKEMKQDEEKIALIKKNMRSELVELKLMNMEKEQVLKLVSQIYDSLD